MKLKLCFNDDSFDVCLFENKTVSKWFRHFKQINSSNNYYTAVNDSLGSNISGYNSASWKNIQDTMIKLESIGFQVPNVSADFDRDQKTLNFLHRFFTYNTLWYYKQEDNPETPNPYDRNFKIPKGMSFQDWIDIIDVINVAVHDLERFTVPHVNKKLIDDHYPLKYVMFNPNRKSHTDLTPWLEFDEEDIKYNYTYFDYDHNYQLVTLNQSILGKCILQSFYENDDPTADDCTGRLGSYGGIVVDLNNNWKLLNQKV
jgi:hypothetical protein